MTSKKQFDVHIQVDLGDFWLIDAHSREEAVSIVEDMILNHTDKILEGLRAGLEFVEPQDIKVTDVVE